MHIKKCAFMFFCFWSLQSIAPVISRASKTQFDRKREWTTTVLHSAVEVHWKLKAAKAARPCSFPFTEHCECVTRAGCAEPHLATFVLELWQLAGKRRRSPLAVRSGSRGGGGVGCWSICNMGVTCNMLQKVNLSFNLLVPYVKSI